MYEKTSILGGIDKLIVQAQHVVVGMRGVKGADDASDTASVFSDNTASFDVAAWGDEMFSLDDMREELERLREETAPAAGSAQNDGVNGGNAVLCKLPAMVPILPRGLFVTLEMQRVLDAVLSDTSTPQIGFCGMGGIGKTTVSCWVTRGDAVRTKFAMVAWITLGQTPVLDSCMDLLHQQIEGSALPDGLSIDQKHEFLQEAFLNRSALLILDDCWEAEIVKHFNWIDRSTNSKILISSRIRDALDGGQIIDVTVPSNTDAVQMLLSTAGMDPDVLQDRAEVAHVADLCKRLPLTIGVAGKLIRQLAQGSTMSDADDWADVVALLEDEMNDPEGSLSIEESVIRASIKAIPKKIQTQVTQLFHGFALIPEDTHVPLPVLGMVFYACQNPANVKPLSRLQVRRYLKVLIDRSLVLGTVDRPQLHDVMLDYVQKELAGDAYRAAQRRLVEELRQSDRSKATVTGKYIQQHVPHHIKESHDPTWGRGKQAIAWLEDHVNGVQDLIAASAASVCPAETLAKEAEASEAWWKAALRWNAFGLMTRNKMGEYTAANPFFKLAVAASAKVGTDVSQFDLDSFDLYGINAIMKAWGPADEIKYGPRMGQVVASKAGMAHPMMCLAKLLSFDWQPAWLSGNPQAFAAACWKLCTLSLDISDPSRGSDLHTFASEYDRTLAKVTIRNMLIHIGDAIFKMPGFDWDHEFGSNGDKLVESFYAYNFEEHHHRIVEMFSMDHSVCRPDAAFVLVLQCGRVEAARKMMDDTLLLTKTFVETPADAGHWLDFVLGCCFLPPTQHFLGLSKHCQKTYDMLGITFDNVEERLDSATKHVQGALYAPLGQKGPGKGLISLERYVHHVKSFCILHLDVPAAKSVAWLESLPDNETFYAYSVTLPTHDVGALPGFYQTVWIALAHEKFELNEGALRFADLQLEQDLLKAGAPYFIWPQVIALACKGRVLAKLSRHDEALAVFQLAIAASKESYSLMEAFAYRELANYAAGGDAAVQAGVDLEAKLKTFEGRMTREEFGGLSIGP